MSKSKCVIKANELGVEIAKELDEMNNTGFGSSVRFMIGEYLGFQVHIIITRDEDEFLELNDDAPLLEFRKGNQSKGDKL